MRVVIFGGTTESRTLSRLMAERGAEVSVCVATDYGREEQGDAKGVAVLTGRKSQKEMEMLLQGAFLCVDATHPYAAEVTRNIRAACQNVGVPYRRLLRRESCLNGLDPVFVDTAAEAADFLADKPGNILLTTGAKELPQFANLDPARLYPRILPTHDGLSACEALGIPHRNIIAMQGPFSRELNEALIRQYQISYLVSKDGGAEGGFPEKAKAAKNTGTALILLRRPKEIGDSYAAIAAYAATLL